jgi:hypothetical protein
MATIVVDTGLQYFADVLAAGFTASKLVHLFSDITGGLTTATVLGDCTEATFPGYAASNAGGPTVTFDSGSSHGVLTFDPVTFTHTGGGSPETIKFWGFSDNLAGGSNRLIAAGAFAPALIMSTAGDAIPVQVVLNDARP